MIYAHRDSNERGQKPAGSYGRIILNILQSMAICLTPNIIGSNVSLLSMPHAGVNDRFLTTPSEQVGDAMAVQTSR